MKMSSALAQMRSRSTSDELAEKYSQLNDYQMKHGKKLFSSLRVKYGDRLRVLDMGCGTGELTAFIADALGHDSEVVGVDPIFDRINIAMNRNCRENLTFILGDCSSEFPHYNEAYYDVHFSNFVFNWLKPEAKDMFIHTAFRILKPGGRFALHSFEESNDVFDAAFELLQSDGIDRMLPDSDYLVNKSVAESMIKRAGFEIIYNEYNPDSYEFENLACFLNWIRATYYISDRELCASDVEKFTQRFANQNGSIIMYEPTLYEIIAMKPE